MANWNNPTVNSNYITFVDEVKDRDIDNARMFDGTAATNIPTLTIRWNQSNNRFERWSGTVWEPRTIGLSGGGTGATSASGARDALGLGLMAQQAPDAVSITGGSITGVSFSSSNASITGGSVFGLTGKTSSRTSTSTALALEAAAMNAHRTSTDHDNRYAPANTVARNKNNISGGTYLERKDGTIPQFFYHSTAGAPSDSPTSSQASVLLMSNTWGDPMISIPNSGDGFYWRNGGSSVWRNAANASNLTSGTVPDARLGTTTTVTFGSPFNGSPVLTLVKIGRVVTASFSIEVLGFTTAATTITAAQVIPVAYRPSVTYFNASTYDSAAIARVRVSTTGVFYMEFRNHTDGGYRSRSAMGAPTMTWLTAS